MKTDKEKQIYTFKIPLGVVDNNNEILEDNEILRKSIDDFNKKVLERKQSSIFVFGEYEREYDKNFENKDLTSLKKVSHSVENVRIEGNNIIGEIKIFNTVMGNKLKEDIDNVTFVPRMGQNIIYTFDCINKDENEK